MKNTIYMFLFAALALTGCSKRVLPQTAEIVHLSSKQDVISLRSTGYGQTQEQALQNAEKTAFETLLFRGIPGSQQSTPLVSINEKEKKGSKKYFDEFYAQQRYKSFLTFSGAQSTPLVRNVKGGKSVTIDLGINLRALRMDLEYHNVIRKFGY